MKFKVLFLFLCYCIPTLGNDFYWRVVKSEVYRTYYNIFISQWLKEQTSEIKLLDLSVDENTEQAKLVIKNASGFDVVTVNASRNAELVFALNKCKKYHNLHLKSANYHYICT